MRWATDAAKVALMRIAVFTTFAASRKEPLADTIVRIHDGLVAAGFGEPTIRFAVADAPASAEITAVRAAAGIKQVSSIARVLKRWPQLERFTNSGALADGRASQRLLTNAMKSGEVEPVDFEILKQIAQGVPRSFPFHSITVHFSALGF